MTRMRSKNISDRDIADIVSVLDGWNGKLSWDLLVDAIERRKHVRYTRQTLHKHERIRHAFGLVKMAPREGPIQREFPELQLALQQNARLIAENARLVAENQRLLEQFATWTYNAYTRGMDEEFLNQSLPRVNRDQSENRLRSVRRKRPDGEQR